MRKLQFFDMLFRYLNFRAKNVQNITKISDDNFWRKNSNKFKKGQKNFLKKKPLQFSRQNIFLYLVLRPE